MADPHFDDGSVMGICMSCKKRKLLHDYAGIKVCEKCADLFDEDLIKKHEQEQYGKDIVNDNKNKKQD